VIVSGRVELLRGEDATSVLTAGDAFGELGVLHHGRYTATARAVGTVELFRVPADTLRTASAAESIPTV
jgi:CRP-like cAMP-binding protein